MSRIRLSSPLSGGISIHYAADAHRIHQICPSACLSACVCAQFMGTVQAVGTGVRNVAAGDRVVACFDIACGRCFQCKQARPSLALLP